MPSATTEAFGRLQIAIGRHVLHTLRGVEASPGKGAPPSGMGLAQALRLLLQHPKLLLMPLPGPEKASKDRDLIIGLCGVLWPRLAGPENAVGMVHSVWGYLVQHKLVQQEVLIYRDPSGSNPPVNLNDGFEALGQNPPDTPRFLAYHKGHQLQVGRYGQHAMHSNCTHG